MAAWDGGAPVIGNVFSGKMIEVFGAPRRPKSELLQVHSDLAASVQLVFEENYFNLLNHVNYINYVGTLTSPYFGRANDAHVPRQIQLSVRVRF